MSFLNFLEQQKVPESIFSEFRQKRLEKTSLGYAFYDFFSFGQKALKNLNKNKKYSTFYWAHILIVFFLQLAARSLPHKQP